LLQHRPKQLDFWVSIRKTFYDYLKIIPKVGIKRSLLKSR